MAIGTIFASFCAALGQMADRRFARVFWLGVGLTLALLIGASAGLLALLEYLFGAGVTLPLIGEVAWLGDLISWAGFGVMLVLSVFLMVPAASAITSMFLDTVADAVEAKHYPHLPKATLWLAGILMAIPLSVPLLNLAIPILGAATFTHLYHRLK
jgi:uncharacterized protein involved in cysteine biosynthesis